MLVYWFVRLIILMLKENCFFRFLSRISAYTLNAGVDENNNRSNRFQRDEKMGEPWNKVASWIY